MSVIRKAALAAALLGLVACGKDSATGPSFVAKDPGTAPKAFIDRFSTAAGHLQVRTATNGLPAANAPVNFDQGVFITHAFAPDGRHMTYYNFDTQVLAPAPIYVLIRQGETTPVQGQMNIIDVLPGDQGYNDFWQVINVTVPANYVANAITSVQEIVAAGYTVKPTSTIVNCPVVPEGSTANLRIGGGDAGLTHGWYRGMVVAYFNFAEAPITATAQGQVPTSPLIVSFNTNPGLPNGGPPSGFLTEPGTLQTHNVSYTIPGQVGYSPLWVIGIYDNADFSKVKDAATGLTAKILVQNAALVNCPIVQIL
jgi:hypothetical protein